MDVKNKTRIKIERETTSKSKFLFEFENDFHIKCDKNKLDLIIAIVENPIIIQIATQAVMVIITIMNGSIYYEYNRFFYKEVNFGENSFEV